VRDWLCRSGKPASRLSQQLLVAWRRTINAQQTASVTGRHIEEHEMTQPLSYDSLSAVSQDFLEGMEHFEKQDLQSAARLFERAWTKANRMDRHYNKYLSYYGLALVLADERWGIDHCRRAAEQERDDADIFYNLARAELRLRHRKGAVEAIERGLRIERRHRPLLGLRQAIGVRRPPFFSFLSRDHFLNRVIGKLTYRKPKRQRLRR
jgi:tetratricopeptide (TPR) repeat protein